MAADTGDDGIVLVDDQYARLGGKFQAALKGITEKPIRFVINTHYHDDHTDGNRYFHQAPVIARDNAQGNARGGGPRGQTRKNSRSTRA